MFYVLISALLFLLIYYIEYKRSKSKVNGGGSFYSAFKKNFQFKYFFLVSFIFTLVSFSIYLLMFKNDLLDFDNVIYIPYIFYTIIVAPIFEEYFYRFLPFEFFKSKSKYKNVLIVILSSLIFTMFHNLEGQQYLFIFIMAASLSLVYLKFKNISYNVMSHSLYNLVLNIFYLSNYKWAFMIIIIFGLFSFLVIFKNIRFVKKS